MPLLYRVSARLGSKAFANRAIGKLRAQSVRALTEGVEVMKREMVTGQLVPVNLGALQQSIVASGRVDRARLVGRIGSSLRQALVMEKGRGAGKRPPPFDPIRRWVERKGIATGKDADRAAFAIARSIGKEGTRIPLKRSGRGGMFKRLTRVMATKWPQIVRRNLRGR